MTKKRGKPRFDQRSRTGCSTCKKRRVKCDESRPVCGSCTRLNLRCHYGITLLWEDEALRKGILFGRARKSDMGAVRNQSLYRDGNLFLNTLYSDLERFFRERGPRRGYQETQAQIIRGGVEREIQREAQREIQTIDLPPHDQHISPHRDSHNHTGSHNHTIHLHSHREKENDGNHEKCIKSEVEGTEIEDKGEGEDEIGDVQHKQLNNCSGELSSEDNIASLDSGELSSENNIASLNCFSESQNNIASLNCFSESQNNFASLNCFDSDSVFSSSFLPTINIFTPQFFHNNRKLEQELFRYFVDNICPSCVSYPHKSTVAKVFPTTGRNPDLNPYLHLVAPLAFRSSLVYKTLVAVASKQLELLGSCNFEIMASLYMSRVLEELPEAIRKKQEAGNGDWDDVLATVLMLCFVEISTSCSDSWLVHLNGAKEILRENLIRSHVTPVSRFFRRWFVAHEVMGQTAWNNLALVADDDYIAELKNDHGTYIDLVLGCSPCLISIINRITVLGDRYDAAAAHETVILQERDLIEAQLCGLRQVLVLNELDSDQQENTCKISEMKRLATLVYLFARVDLEYYLHHQKNSPAAKYFNERFAGVKQAMARIQELMVSLPSISMSMLWPLFVVGIVAVETDDERWFVLSRLLKMEKIRELASIKIARRVVERVWKEKDLRGGVYMRWKEMIGGAETISLA